MGLFNTGLCDSCCDTGCCIGGAPSCLVARVSVDPTNRCFAANCYALNRDIYLGRLGDLCEWTSSLCSDTYLYKIGLMGGIKVWLEQNETDGYVLRAIVGARDASTGSVGPPAMWWKLVLGSNKPNCADFDGAVLEWDTSSSTSNTQICDGTGSTVTISASVLGTDCGSIVPCTEQTPHCSSVCDGGIAPRAMLVAWQQMSGTLGVWVDPSGTPHIEYFDVTVQAGSCVVWRQSYEAYGCSWLGYNNVPYPTCPDMIVSIAEFSPTPFVGLTAATRITELGGKLVSELIEFRSDWSTFRRSCDGTKITCFDPPQFTVPYVAPTWADGHGLYLDDPSTTVAVSVVF